MDDVWEWARAAAHLSVRPGTAAGSICGAPLGLHQRLASPVDVGRRAPRSSDVEHGLPRCLQRHKTRRGHVKYTPKYIATRSVTRLRQRVARLDRRTRWTLGPLLLMLILSVPLWSAAMLGGGVATAGADEYALHSVLATDDMAAFVHELHGSRIGARPAPWRAATRARR
jgi:hypothetical protein